MSFADAIVAGNKAFSRKDKGVLLPVLALHMVQRGGKPDYRPGFRGSAVGKMCCREEVFKKLLPRNYPPIGAYLGSIFETGHAMHHRWQNHVLGPAGILEGWWQCKTCGWKIEGVMPGDICPKCKSLRRCGSCKAKLKDKIYIKDHTCKKCKSESWEYEEYSLEHKELGIVGHCDGVININGVKYIWEFKTINENGFENRIPYAPLKEHVAQVQVYMWLKKIPLAIIHYLNKNTSEEKEFTIKYDEGFRREIIRKIKLVRRHMDKGTLPDTKACSTKYTRRAKECPWVKECFSEKVFQSAIKEVAEQMED